MSGAMKDFLDRTYYPCEGKVESLPYAIFISADNDGSGALSSIQRIAMGFPLRAVQEPIIARGETTNAILSRLPRARHGHGRRTRNACVLSEILSAVCNRGRVS